MTTVVVLGPNGHWEGETMHVHAKGCRDITKSWYREVRKFAWEDEVHSDIDVITSIYEPACFDYDPTDPAELSQYEGDIKIFPCVAYDSAPEPAVVSEEAPPVPEKAPASKAVPSSTDGPEKLTCDSCGRVFTINPTRPHLASCNLRRHEEGHDRETSKKG